MDTLLHKWPALLLLLLGPLGAATGDTTEERRQIQAALDAACESARQARLTVLRAEYVEECLEKQQRPDRAACERFYADYGDSSAGNRVPLFYDLPACVRANEHRRSYRRPSS